MPLVMLDWAKDGTAPMQVHLHQAYAHDAVLGPDTEKKMELVMCHYEAVLWVAVKDRAFSLGGFYKIDHIVPRSSSTMVVAPVPNAGNITTTVTNLGADNIENVIACLREGYIAMSCLRPTAGLV
eukprot:5378514-Amphidinium_carterae.1